MGSIQRTSAMMWALAGSLLAACPELPRPGTPCVPCATDTDCQSVLEWCAVEGAARCCRPRAQCAYPQDPACDDGDPCTVDTCAVDSMCVHAAPERACEVDGVCLDCSLDDDAAACRVGVCEPGVGCVSALAAEGAACRPGRCDGTLHTPAAACSADGECALGEPPQDCAAGLDACTVEGCLDDLGCAPVTRATPDCGLARRWGVVSLKYTCTSPIAASLSWEQALLDLSTSPQAGIHFGPDGDVDRVLAEVDVQAEPDQGLIRARFDGTTHYGAINLDDAIMALKPEDEPGGLSVAVAVGSGHPPQALAGRWLTILVASKGYDANQMKPHTVVGETVFEVASSGAAACVRSANWTSGDAFGTDTPSRTLQGSQRRLGSDYNALRAGGDCIAVAPDGEISGTLRLVYGPVPVWRGWLSADGDTAIAVLTTQTGAVWKSLGALLMRRMPLAGSPAELRGRYSALSMGAARPYRGMLSMTAQSVTGDARFSRPCVTCAEGTDWRFVEGAVVASREGHFRAELVRVSDGVPSLTRWHGATSIDAEGPAGSALFWEGNSTLGGALVPTSGSFGVLVRHPVNTPWQLAPWDQDPEAWCTE